MKAILAYHSIDDSRSPISLTARGFEAQLDWLASNDVRVVGLTDLLALPDGDGAVALTFDDGFASFGAEAWPRLRERGLPATLFVVTGRVGKSNRWSGSGFLPVPEMPLLDWRALEALVAEGVEIGAHTRTHPDLRTISGPELEDEVVGAAGEIEERLGVAVRSFAYPYGVLSPAATAAVRTRFDAACTTEFRALRRVEDPCLLPRLDAFYFQSAGSRLPWGSAALGGYVRLRAGIRTVRPLLHRLAASR
jgi:peptidoglycan/xylan/chitin deacetylase (PgdA/CDA1 family)